MCLPQAWCGLPSLETDLDWVDATVPRSLDSPCGAVFPLSVFAEWLLGRKARGLRAPANDTEAQENQQDNRFRRRQP